MNADRGVRPSGAVSQLEVWLMTVGEPLPFRGDTARPWRSGLLANMLVARGHVVTWWTSTVDHFNKRFFVTSSARHAVSERLALQFLHGRLYRRNISWARWRNHQQIAAEFARLAPEQERPDIILCSYPTIELSAEAVRFGQRRGIPVLLDIRDLWPDEMAARLPRLVRPLARSLLWPMYRDAKFALGNATGLVAISGRYLEWGVQHGRRQRSPTDAMFTHGYPAQDRSVIGESTAELLAELGIQPSQRVFWFVGTFVGSIDLGTVIETARRMDGNRDVVFVLTGSGENDREWREQARDLSNVVFTGWVDKGRLAALASIAWVGLAAYKAGALMSLTNKLFEYMAYGLPVLISLPEEAREVVEAANCGIFYEPGSPESLLKAAGRLCSDPALRDTMAANARVVFEEQFSADRVYANFAAHLEAVAAVGQPRVSNSN